MSKSKDVYKPSSLEILATKMITEIYPQILLNLNDLEDASVNAEFEDMTVNFQTYPARGGLEMRCSRKGTTQMYGHNSLWVMDDNKFKDMCPVFDSASFNSQQYMNICEACIVVLDDLRKRKQKILKLIDKIDAIPTALQRLVLIEKIQVERQN